MSIVTPEEYTCRTWPALETITYDGWLLRFGDGCTNRSNAVYPLYRSTYDIDRKIAYVEQEYASRGLRAAFRLTEAAKPPALEAALQAAGYATHEPSFVMTASLSGEKANPESPVRLNASFSDSWLDSYFEFQPARLNQRDGYKQLLTQPVGQRVYATVEADGKTVAVGLGSRSRDYVGVYNMATHPEYRGRGYAGAIVRALLARAYEQGAHHAILCVSSDNEAAQRIYERCGFTKTYPYRYRVQTAP